MANYTQRPKSRRSADYKRRNDETNQVDEREESAARAAKRSKKNNDDDEDDDRPRAKKRRKKESLFTRLVRAIFPVRGDPPAEAIRKIVFDVAVVALVITGGSVLYDLLDEAKQITVIEEENKKLYLEGALKLDDEQKEAIKREQPEILDSFMALYAENPDIVGWIEIGDFISYPVLQADDNDYYLEHNFQRETTKSGAIFADYRNLFAPGEISGNTVLYGHNVWSGSMFARLSRYYESRLHNEYANRLDFYKKYPTITFNTLYEESEWKVFACCLFNTRDDLGEVYPYTQVQEFAGREEFNSYILEIMDRSAFWTDVDLTYGDSILTLSTCYQYSPYSAETDTRCAVFARKVRPGESAEVDVSKVVENPNPLMFTYQRQAEGGSEWKGRSWDTSKLLSYETY
ncbi:MAG: class B sortase [Bacteroides sp.]|nr:class B sortase [Eubacterium sp.]MCM1418693.1 class B sortase [Roseburia sp.]MCM1462721.1 class B sortase [Bacteroides sp.]